GGGQLSQAGGDQVAAGVVALAARTGVAHCEDGGTDGVLDGAHLPRSLRRLWQLVIVLVRTVTGREPAGQPPEEAVLDRVEPVHEVDDGDPAAQVVAAAVLGEGGVEGFETVVEALGDALATGEV